MDWNVNNAFKTYKDMETKSVMDMTLIPSIDPMEIGLGSSEKGISVPLAKPRKKTMTSVYLKYFEIAPDGKSRSCKFCGQNYASTTATGNLGRHLSNRHPGYDKSGDNSVTSVSTAVSAHQPVVTVKRGQSQGKSSTQVDYDHLNWFIIRWLVLSSLPPSTLDEKWIVNSYKFLNPSVDLWSSDRYKAVFREVFRSMQEDVKASLEQILSKVSITLDFWTSYEKILYMSVTCQWIDDNWSFQRMLLDICHIPHPCGGTEIYHSLVKVLKSFNLEGRVLSCTHDNSQYGMHACHGLKEDFDGRKVGPFCYMPCAARTLNMIIDDGLKTTKPVISKVREFALELNASSEISEDFIQLATAYQEGSWKLPLDTSTRWSGSYLTLDIVRKASKSMDGVIRKHEGVLGSRLMLSSAEKNAVSIVHSYLEPFYKTTNNICANKFPTVGLVLFFMDHIAEMISACRDSRHSPDWLKNAAEDMSKKVRVYNNQVCNIFTYMTAVLDPRIKSELIPESLNLDNYLEEARAHFVRNYASNHFPSVNSGFGPQEIADCGSVSFAEEIARKKRRGNMSSATDELTQYLSEPPAPMPSDVLEWWKINSTRYPRLSLMARDFLPVQATSVAPEELFCSKGDEVDKRRFSMPHDSTQALLCVKSWTECGMRLKYKSTEIDYDRLMEMAATAAAGNSSSGLDKKGK
ncbi:uncharacterized protein LOC116213455 [Punica granatum]|uniref:Uncharacterized protein LOC116213455 n=2 Tax=Punica granatum TaxID=22663 RepID=A0A6P8EAQ0_PUNGR|nr:uncharacterized protein LOC116213455 [Punica granatum]XP_031404266.1 uncharacterized protein LOC116213455 [Punica granatum]OWM65165.1 hypothetical protein CDL15_Pgr008752 [Punica granatum]PKI43898.1 hypothetical protein CRG98_035732 [Punica granatum]